LQEIVVRFQRLVRDLSQQLDKEVEFITSGTNTEIDKK
jgi:two-component system chemotaxis sensor kinase CheA